MNDDVAIGYQNPPKHTRFKPGVSGNPKGRTKRSPAVLGKIIAEVLSAPVSFREGGRTKVLTRQEVTIKMLIDQAIKGNLAAAEQVLKIRAHAKRFGDAGAQRLLITDWLPDYPGQTAEQKTSEASVSTPDDPHAWWEKPQKR